MLPAHLHSTVLRYTNSDRMFSPNMDLADGRQESTRDRWVQQQMEEAMRHLQADLEVLPSPLLLEQMEREAVQRRSPPAPLVARPDLAAKPASFSRRRKRRRGAPSCFSASEEESPMAAVVTSVTSGLQQGLDHCVVGFREASACLSPDALALHKALFLLLEAIPSEAPGPLIGTLFCLPAATVFF
ncbi:hypothetical protein CRENBAI_011949 [Crenichthys baileyi]|uniref:Uncharacterized protein n=1 Tax=Crenichthys baileyi TaxID=28760 RepID=A0AAV9RDM2_9TELE